VGISSFVLIRILIAELSSGEVDLNLESFLKKNFIGSFCEVVGSSLQDCLSNVTTSTIF